MGADDANEGHEAGECLEHRWLFVGTTLVSGEGAYMEYSCERCGGSQLRTPPKRLP